MGKILTVAEQFEAYLKRVGMSKASMHPIQYTETRRAFYAGAGQILTSARDDVSRLPEDEGILEFERWWQECTDFWNKEAKDYDTRKGDVSDA